MWILAHGMENNVLVRELREGANRGVGGSLLSRHELECWQVKCSIQYTSLGNQRGFSRCERYWDEKHRILYQCSEILALSTALLSLLNFRARGLRLKKAKWVVQWEADVLVPAPAVIAVVLLCKRQMERFFWEIHIPKRLRNIWKFICEAQQDPGKH